MSGVYHWLTHAPNSFAKLSNRGIRATGTSIARNDPAPRFTASLLMCAGCTGRQATNRSYMYRNATVANAISEVCTTRLQSGRPLTVYRACEAEGRSQYTQHAKRKAAHKTIAKREAARFKAEDRSHQSERTLTVSNDILGMVCQTAMQNLMRWRPVATTLITAH